MEKLKGLSSRSEEVQEIMGKPPHWTLKAGMTIICLTLLTFGVLAYQVHYPEVVSIKLLIPHTTKNINIQASSPLLLTQVCVDNGQHVTKGDTLATFMTLTGHNKTQEVIRAPENGVISYPDARFENTSFKTGEAVFILSISESPHIAHRSHFYGFLTKEEAHRIKSGMKVNLISADHATKICEFGTIGSVAASPNQRGKYYFEVNGNKNHDDTTLFTDYECEAEIIVDNPRIINHFLPNWHQIQH